MYFQNQNGLWKWRESPQKVPQTYLMENNFILFIRNSMLLKIAGSAPTTITIMGCSGCHFYTSNEINIYIQPYS